MNIRNRFITGVLAVALTVGAVLAPMAASAQSKSAKREKQHRINAAALGAAGLYLYGRKQTTLGTIAIAGSAYEAKRMQDSINDRHRRARAAAYRRGYRNGQTYAMNRTRYRTGSIHYKWVRGKDGKMHRIGVRTWASTRGKKKGWSKNGKR